MGGGGATDDNSYEYEKDLAEANASEFGEEGVELILGPMADDIAGSATDAEEAMQMCEDMASAEDLSEDDLSQLLEMVEERTGWELPRDES